MDHATSALADARAAVAAVDPDVPPNPLTRSGVGNARSPRAPLHGPVGEEEEEGERRGGSSHECTFNA